MGKPAVRIDERDALALHDRLLAMFGGAAGLRNEALLQSALKPELSGLSHYFTPPQTPPHQRGGAYPLNSAPLLPPPRGEGRGGALGHESSLLDMASAYITGIVRNHPFVDGNKRTGFAAGVLFLELNGFRFNASEADAPQVIMNLAAGTLDEAGLIGFLRENVKSDSE